MGAWLEDKIILWGIPLETKWEEDGPKGIFNPDTYTNIRVISTIQGDVPSTIKVYHHENGAACGFQYLHGQMQLIVLPPKMGSHYSSDLTVEFEAKTLAVYAYINKGLDFPFRALRQIDGIKFDCNADGINASDAETCKWQMLYFAQADSYMARIEELSD